MALDLQYGKDEKNRAHRIDFDSDAANYDKTRPRYCPELFEAVICEAGLTAQSKLLEIGPGTGQATEPFLAQNCSITAVELGEHLAEYLRLKYEDRENLTVWQGDFLQFPEEEQFDLIYSATAFHWIPREEGFTKVKRLLKPGGTLALFWNHPVIGGGTDSSDNQTVQPVYRKFGQGSDAKPFDGSSCAAYEESLREAGFVSVRSQLFTSWRILTGDQYVQLMRSYSGHGRMQEEVRLQFEQEMAEAIQNAGDALHIKDIMDLYLAKMPE